ncbi:cytochrome P450 [Tanacetum coccineum]
MRKKTNTHSHTSSLPSSISFSNNDSNIKRCNDRLLNLAPLESVDSEDEVMKTLKVGILLGYSLEGMENEVHATLGIQESKTSEVDLPFIHSLWGNTDCDYAFKKSDGFSGGINALWDCSLFKKQMVLDSEDGFLAIFGEWEKIKMDCLIIVIYAPQDRNKKRSLWSRLTHLIRNFQSMYIVVGDFNKVWSVDKRLGSSFCALGAQYFNAFISDSELIDLPMGGKRFTRMNKYGTKLSKIDRILVSHHFVSNWPNAQLTTLPRKLSDHCPLVLKTHSADYGPIPFKFFNSWLLKSELL